MEFPQAVQAARSTMASAQVGAAVERLITSRRGRDEQLEEQAIKNGQIHGFVDLDGAGEVVVDVAFPVVFLEKPVFTYGHELADNHWPRDGHFPVASSSVVAWDVRTAPGDRSFWQGAKLAVVVFGLSTMKSILHYEFKGQIFTNPSTSDTSIGGAL